MRRLIPVPVLRHVVVLVSVLAVASAGAVAAHSPDPMMGGDHWTQDQTVGFDWKTGQVPPAWLQEPVRDAAADSNASRASRAAVFVLADGAPSAIAYGEPTPCGPNGIACFSRAGAPERFGMWFRRHGHAFDWGYLRWCQAYTSWPDGCYDVENIALDEFGHVQILGHHQNYDDQRDYGDAVVQALSRTKPRAYWDAHRYGRCDVAVLQREYDVPSRTTLISSCLDLGTSLSLAASDTPIAYRGGVTFTATLRVATNTAYDRLSANLLSGRTVLLQRRATGSTSWSTVGEMTPGTAGTYTWSATPLVTAEWRAVFPEPPVEGVRASTSGSVTVSVGACTTSCPLVIDPRHTPQQGDRR